MRRPLSSRAFAAILVTALTLSTASLISWGRPLFTDAGIFSLLGRFWLNGAVPYRDFWDNKPPVLLLLNAAADLLGDVSGLGPATAIHLMAAFFVVVLSAAMAGLVRGFGAGRVVASLTGLTAVCFFAGYPFAAGGGFSEPPAFALALVAWLLVERSNRPAALLTAGALAAASLLTSYLAAGLLAGPILALMARPGSVRSRLAGLAIMAAGTLTVAGPLLLYFVYNGAFNDLWSALVSYNLAYATVHCPIANTNGSWPCLSNVPFWPSLIIFAAFLVPLTIAALLGLRAGLTRGVLLRLLVVLSISGLLAYSNLHRLPGSRYWWPIVAGLLPLAAMGLARYSWRHTWMPGSKPASMAKWGAMLLLVAQLVVPGGAALQAQAQANLSQDAVESRTQLIAALADAAPSPGPLLVWGNNATIYLYSSRAPLGNKVDLFALQLPGYASADMFGSMCRLVAMKRPVIIDEDADISLIGNAATPTGIEASWLAPLRAIVISDYEAIGRLTSPSGEQYDTVLIPRAGAIINASACGIVP